MSRYRGRCEDCVRCESCDETAYCLSEPGTRPCPHDRTLCGECVLDPDHGCPRCRLDAEAAMFAADTYSPEGDPFYNPKGLDPNYATDLATWSDEYGTSFPRRRA